MSAFALSPSDSQYLKMLKTTQWGDVHPHFTSGNRSQGWDSNPPHLLLKHVLCPPPQPACFECDSFSRRTSKVHRRLVWPDGKIQVSFPEW